MPQPRQCDLDLFTPKPNQFVLVPRCINDKSLAKIHEHILEILRKHSLGRTDARMEACKTYSLHHPGTYFASSAGLKGRISNWNTFNGWVTPTHTEEFGFAAVYITVINFCFDWTETRQSPHKLQKVDWCNKLPSQQCKHKTNFPASMCYEQSPYLYNVINTIYYKVNATICYKTQT